MKKNTKINILVVLFLIFTVALSTGAEREFGFFSKRASTVIENTEKVNESNKITKISEDTEKIEDGEKDYNYSTSTGSWVALDENTWVMDTDNNKENGYEITLTYNGKEWLYEFAVEDTDRDYYVFEDIIRNDLKGRYTSKGSDGQDASRYDPGIIKKEDTANGVVYTITNTRNEYITGGFKVSKKVKASDKDKLDTKFLFKITLEEKEEEIKEESKEESEEESEEKEESEGSFNLEGVHTFGKLTFVDGVATTLLGDGDSVLIEDLPVGVRFKVEEVNLGYNWSGKVVIGESSGVVTEDLTEVGFENTYKKPEEKVEFGGFKLKKEVIGFGDKNQEYSFLVSLDGITKDGVYSYSISGKDFKKDYTFKADSSGSANIYLNLKKDEVAEFKELPVGARYQVLEKAGEYKPSYTITDTISVNKISNSNDGENKDLSTELEVVDKDENSTITFVNELNSIQDLRIKKILEDEDSKDKVFLINLKLSNLEARKTYKSDFGIIIADERGEYECDIKIQGGQVITIEGLPVGARYKVTELANEYVGSFTIEAKDGVIVSPNGENEIQGKDISTEEEVIDPGEEATVCFVNKKPESYARLKLIKYSNEGDKKKIGPARYNLYQNNYDKGKEDSLLMQVYIKEDGESDILENINPGKYYVVEVQAPPGYALNPVRHDFEITKDHLEKVIEIEVYDDKIIIPLTGGSGISIIPVIGMGILILSVCGLILKRGKKDEEV